MPQDIPSRSSLLTPEASASDPAAAESSAGFNPAVDSVESIADRLMDSIFGDLERSLERGGDIRLDLGDEAIDPDGTWETGAGNTAAIEPVTPEEAAPSTGARPLDLSSLAVLPKLSPRQLTLGEPEIDADLLLATESEETAIAPDRSSLDGLLIALIVATLAITGGLWLFFRQRLPQPTAPIAASSPTAVDPQAQQDSAFLEYVSRALERIDRARQDQLASGIPSSPTAPAPTTLDRVYPPVYQSPAATSSALPNLPPTTIRTIPLTPPAALPSVTVPPAPALSPAAPAPAPTQSPVAVIPNISPSPSHELIGLLELGDRSAALFEVDGTPQRVQIGERIGASGWTLVSVANQEAIIRRNGEVRSIYIGQQF